MLSLEGKVAIVTGGSAGIGLGIARGMAQAGADIVIAARRADRVESACAAVRATGRRVIGVPTDVTKADQVGNLVQATVDAFGTVDILVNNAGGSFGPTFRRAPLLELTEADLDGAMAANVKSIFLCGKAVAPLMMAQGKGAIINIGSIAGHEQALPRSGAAFYAASKGAAIKLTYSMAVEWAPAIRVNCINPGGIPTERVMENRSPERTAFNQSMIAMGRPGTPHDIAVAAIFLASDEANWITGTVIDVHGGHQFPGFNPASR